MPRREAPHHLLQIGKSGGQIRSCHVLGNRQIHGAAVVGRIRVRRLGRNGRDIRANAGRHGAQTDRDRRTGTRLQVAEVRRDHTACLGNRSLTRRGRHELEPGRQRVDHLHAAGLERTGVPDHDRTAEGRPKRDLADRAGLRDGQIPRHAVRRAHETIDIQVRTADTAHGPGQQDAAPARHGRMARSGGGAEKRLRNRPVPSIIRRRGVHYPGEAPRQGRPRANCRDHRWPAAARGSRVPDKCRGSVS